MPPGAVDGTSVSDEEIGALLDDLADAPLGADADGDFRLLIPVRGKRPLS